MIIFVNQQRYTSQDLTGLTVEHALDKFDEGRKIILTLKDKGQSL